MKVDFFVSEDLLARGVRKRIFTGEFANIPRADEWIVLTEDGVPLRVSSVIYKLHSKEVDVWVDARGLIEYLTEV